MAGRNLSKSNTAPDAEDIRARRRREADERMREMIRRDWELQADEEALIRHLDECEASGVSSRTVLDIMRDVKAELKGDGQVRSDRRGRR